MAKTVQAWISDFDPTKISLDKDEIIKFDLLIERKNRIFDFVSKHLAISPQDNLKEVVAEFIFNSANFYELWKTHTETDFEQVRQVSEELAKNVTQKVDLEKVY